ncbi:MAG: ribonuclease P protein component [Bacteroidales bacterium]|nr:ribonuclease P protein component [Bacteroidales bacterium]
MYRFKKDERIKGKLTFQKIISDGESYFKYPYKFYWRLSDIEQKYPIQVGISISKRNIKMANKRNLIKRRIREVYRLNKQIFYRKLENENIRIQLLIIYLADKPITFVEIRNYLVLYLNDLILKVCEENPR